MRIDYLNELKGAMTTFSDLCDREAPSLCDKYSLGKDGIGVYDVQMWLKNFSRMKNTPGGMTLVYDPQQMLRDFSSMRGIGPDDVTETEV